MAQQTMGRPGARFTREARLADLLMAQEAAAPPIQSHTQGLASMLRQGLAGYMMGQDDRNRTAASAAMARGMGAQPWVSPDTGQVSTAPAGGLAGAEAALAGMADNPYAARDLRGLLLSRAVRDEDRAYKSGLAKTARDQAIEDEERRRAAGREDYQFQQEHKAFRPVRPVPGRDVPFPADVAEQRRVEAGTRAAASRPTPEELGQAETAKAQARASVKKASLRPKAEAALTAFRRKQGTLRSTIEAAKQQVSGWATGWGAALLGELPQTEAFNLQRTLDTIRANVGFDRLQEMRDNSPTGGALGQVSEMENRLLQATEGSLDPRQNAEQLLSNLDKIMALYEAVKAEKEAAFQADYDAGDGGALAVPGAIPADLVPVD